MEMSKRMAIAVSGLMVAGGAALTVGTAGSASAASAISAQTTVAAPMHGCGGGCRSRSCCSRNHHHSRHHHRFHYRNHDRAIVLNRNQNWSKSDVGQQQRQQQRQELEEQQHRSPHHYGIGAPGVL